ncbi:PfkB family carbohydrate kinase [Agromyces sp. MMS24-JH15]|uniref:PfkB family carbohydrate kinase n=1 Tax=Agromyces sp. MMS24-JH15 TaxID=3243765 RepID=UPI0037482545
MPEHTPEPSRPRITVVGDALIDELRDPNGSREFVGGAALNVAVGLSLLGDDVTLVAMVGDDEPGRRIRAYLDDYGVRLVASPSPHGSSRAISDRRDGEPRYEFNEAAQRRALRFDEATLRAIDEADLVVVSCFPFDDAEQSGALRDAIARSADRLLLDGNPRAGMLRDRAAFVATFEEFVARSLLVKVGDEDAALLLDATLGAFVDRLAAAAAAADPARDRPLAVLATAGRDGAAVHHGDLQVHAGIVPLPGAVVDTMGAGDATLSAIAHHVGRSGLPADEASWTVALASAMAIAAATVRHEGALLRVPATREPVELLGS